MGPCWIVGHGIDVLDVRRLLRLAERGRLGRLAGRILSEEERRLEPPERHKLVSFLANRWAAKEAAYKALYPAFKPAWKHLALLPGPPHAPQKPQLLLLNHPHLHLLVSISHDAHFTIASAFASSDHPAPFSRNNSHTNPPDQS